MASAGHSDYTPVKQEHFEVILRAHMQIAISVARKRREYDRYVYIDLNAGPGIYPDGKEGSPAIALRVARELDIPIDLWLFEKDAATVETLAGKLGLRPGVRILHGDHSENYWEVVAAYEKILGLAYGLVYHDPNCDCLPVEVLRELTTGPLGRMDILAHVNANGAYKRTRQFHQDRFLSTDLLNLGKRYIWLRRPLDDWQWTMAIASNWPDFPEFRRQGFYSLRSVEGRGILEYLDLSERERKNGHSRPSVALPPVAKQLTLFPWKDQ